ncbi:hypothetical protein Ccrd_024253 [Cynara cardunculus var. scolymus]|uniref:Uncharacterized protein n=1 Tax=Cynara cardunculus var. scolymus TaxID=59895 RepID=A0A124SAR0_CYNCS|nr:hypothetical protein Ccrd_024253 [Cynara cardunculus var. scolymus]
MVQRSVAIRPTCNSSCSIQEEEDVHRDVYEMVFDMKLDPI